MMLEVNFPLAKADHPAMSKWLNTHIIDAGDLPSANTLRETYVPKIGQANKEAVRHIVEDKQIVFLSDETTDKSSSSFVCGCCDELPAATGSECSRAILLIVSELGIKFENDLDVVTDSAKYTTTCVTSLKGIFIDGMVHVQCWAHKLSIVASLWSASLTELNMCVANAKHAFVNARKRKYRYVTFLKDKYPEDEKKHTLFPLPGAPVFSSVLIPLLPHPHLISFTLYIEKNNRSVCRRGWNQFPLVHIADESDV
ncbi:hypothetical protein PR048_031335 [Dryococelus australis]|uniref:DUF659 domain-containing protein n=1 Tax=Dryococelus australis TaxID=614101 RepID=A0ABQ9G4Y5_9NEOP|nr:hypothetical protein PR048_031335 [Dryococelus australis]